MSDAVELHLQLTCGCRVVVHEGPAYEIPFGRLPRLVAEVEDLHRCARSAA